MERNQINEVIDEIYNKEIRFFTELQNMTYTEGGFNKNSLIELGILLFNNAKPDMKVCEIGCWTGFSTSILAKITKEFGGILTTIDWFNGSPTSNLTTNRVLSPKTILEFNLSFLKLKEFVNIIDNTSKEANKQFKNEHFDFIFIDADHRYEMIKEDIDLWYTKLKNGGILCGHDCEYLVKNQQDILKIATDIDFFQAHVGVIKAVSERFPDYKITETGNIWWIKK